MLKEKLKIQRVEQKKTEARNNDLLYEISYIQFVFEKEERY